MDTSMRIQIRVEARKAIAEINAMSGAVKTAQRAMAGSSGGGSVIANQARDQGRQLSLMERASIALTGELGRSKRGMLAFGKDLQWVGRQLNFNFTIPLLAAGTAAGTWYMESERAWTRVKKVYGDGTRSTTQDLEKLRRGFRLLSDYYGVNKAEVEALAAEWAAAGYEGAALGKAVQNTLDFAILGDYQDLTAAYKDLIVVQSAYKLNSEGLRQVIADLNHVENSTKVSLQDLVRAMALSGGMAATAGIGYKELAGYITALVPATGSANRAGNALKTIISRMVAPTQDMLDVFTAMGTSFEEMNSQNMTAGDRLRFLAGRYAELTDSQRAYVASVAGSREQVNRFIALIDAMNSPLSDLNKTMRQLDPASKEYVNTMQTFNKEIETLLQSDPKKVEILTNQMKNMMVDAIIPLIPSIIGLLTVMRELFVMFSELSPETQQWIFMTLAGVAAVGVLAQAIGSAQILLATLLRPLVAIGLWFSKTLIPILANAGKAVMFFVNPWTLALAAIGLLIWVFRDEVEAGLVGAVRMAQSAFNSLPGAIKGAFQGVINVIAGAIKIIRNLLSYLNPFARHSPSLVDNVKAGVRIIAAEYASLSGFANAFGRAADNLRDFHSATEGARGAATSQERGEQRTKVTAVSPDAGSSLDALFADMDALKGMLATLTPMIESQTAAVEEARQRYDEASEGVERFDRSLDPLRAHVEDLEQAIDAANQTISDLASTPIAGMDAMSDAIFENEQAQKRLRLELLRMGDVGDTYDDIVNKIGRLNGDIESVKARITDLRSAGAGSDILSIYENELAALEAQRDGLKVSESATEALEKQLQELQKQGEILDLEKSLNFDPLLRQIDELANGTKELTFDEIVNGIKAQQQAVANLTPEYERQTDRLRDQEAVLAQMELARDALQASYDTEETKLQNLNKAYGEIEAQLREIEKAINDVVAAHQTLNEAGVGGAGGGGGGGGAGGGGGFDDLTGDWEDPTAGFDTGEMGSIEDWVAEWENKVKGMFSDFKPFDKIKEKWSEFRGWWDANVIPAWNDMMDALSTGKEVTIDFFKNLDLDAGDLAGKLGTAIQNGWNAAIDAIPGTGMAGDLFGKIFGGIPDSLDGFGGTVVEALDDIIEGFSEFQDIAGPAWKLLKTLKDEFMIWGKGLLIVAGFFATLIATALRPFVDYLGRSLGPVIENIGRMIGGFAQVVAGALGIIINVLNGDWTKAWDSFKTMMSGVMEIFLTLPNMIWGAIQNIGILVADFFQIGVDMMQGLIDGIGSIAQSIVDTVVGWFNDFVTTIKALLGISSPSTVFFDIGIDIMQGLWDGLVAAVVAVTEWFTALPGNILTWIGDVSQTLYMKGRDFITGLGTGITNKAVDVTNWFVALPGNVLNWIGNTTGTLIQKGREFIGGLSDGVQERWNVAKEWFVALPERISSTIGPLLETLLQKGRDLIEGIGNGAEAAWSTVREWFVNMGVRVGGAIGNMLDVLSGVGGDLVQGLKNGAEAKWNSVKGWFAGIADRMKDIFTGKWLIGSPSKLFYGYGVNLMEGLQGGVQHEWPVTRNLINQALNEVNSPSVQGYSRQVTGTAMGPNSGGRTVNLYGDLVLPNITSGDDAGKLIDNLEMIAG